MLKGFKPCAFAKNGNIEFIALFDQISDEIVLIHRDADPVWSRIYLPGRIDNIAVISISHAGDEYKQSVGQLMHCFLIILAYPVKS